MRNYLSKGFTLIELLIVIAVLGILAVAVLSAINPIEQINRSRDTGSQSDAEQLISAIDRYYATQNALYPWQTTSTDPTAQDWVEVTDAWAPAGAPGETVLGRLSAAGNEELKTSFTNRITATGYNTLRIYNEGATGNSNYVCFPPKSGAFKTQAETRCTAASGLPDDFPQATACAGGNGANPYWTCLP